MLTIFLFFLLLTLINVNSYMMKSIIIKKSLHSRLYSENEQTTKGFGTPKPKTNDNSDEIVEKDAGTMTYEAQQKRGVPEYNIFMRTTGGGDEEWIPVGSMTIPRDTPVARAVFEVEKELLEGTFKLYPKMKAFYDVRSDEDKETTFEYGFCLKAFPDEVIEIINREDAQPKQGNFFQNWLGSITNPMDSSNLNSNNKTLKQ